MTVLTFNANVNYHAAVKAMEELNFTPLNERRIRISPSNRDSRARNNDEANVFIKVSFTDSSPVMSIIESFSAWLLSLAIS